jgi:UPF0271 protein
MPPGVEHTIDLNCDLGEGCPHDAELLSLITSANVACGLHAGDAPTARRVLRLAVQCGVQVGAHPSYPDRESFGRREMARAPEDIFADLLYQMGALAALAHSVGAALTHVKPHGALYNQACRDDAVARPVIEAAVQFRLPVLGLPGSRLEALAAGRCPFIAEGFADRRYLPDGSLTPRSRPDAFITDMEDAVRQAQELVQVRGVRTLCVHGDNPDAVAFVRRLREAFLKSGWALRPFCPSAGSPAWQR